MIQVVIQSRELMKLQTSTFIDVSSLADPTAKRFGFFDHISSNILKIPSQKPEPEPSIRRFYSKTPQKWDFSSNNAHIFTHPH